MVIRVVRVVARVIIRDIRVIRVMVIDKPFGLGISKCSNSVPVKEL